MKTFLEILWTQLTNPVFWIFMVVAITILFIVFRKFLRFIPLLTMILFGICLGSLLPSFILEYHHEVSGTILGIEKSITVLKGSNGTSEDILTLERYLEEQKVTLELFDQAKGWDMYDVFFSNIDGETYSKTIERYSPAVILNSYGLIGLLVGALGGFAIWLVLKLFFWVMTVKRKKE